LQTEYKYWVSTYTDQKQEFDMTYVRKKLVPKEISPPPATVSHKDNNDDEMEDGVVHGSDEEQETDAM